MYPYKYTVSLRVRHPKIDPDNITKIFCIQPSRKWLVGDPRSDPKGNKLKGINRETYWAAKIHKEKKLSSRKILLEDFWAVQIDELKKSEKHLRRIRKTGGSIEFFVGLFCNKNIGTEIPSLLLASMGKLGIDLSLDIYPEK